MEAVQYSGWMESDTESVHSDDTATRSTLAAAAIRSGRSRRKGNPRRAAMGDTISDAAAFKIHTSHNECDPVPLNISRCSIPDSSSPTVAVPPVSAAEAAPAEAAPEATAITSTAAAVIPATAAAGAGSSKAKKSKQDLAGPCCHCNATSSPQWRKGPKGKPVLCNACGIRFLRNRTLNKVVPKKRRAGGGGTAAAPSAAAAAAVAATAAGPVAASPPPKRARVEETVTEDDEVELATDEVLATEDVLATDDGLEEAHSGLAAMGHQMEHPHAMRMTTSRLAAAVVAAAAAAADSMEEDEEQEQSSLLPETAARLAAAAAQKAAAAAAAAAGASSSSSYGLLGCIAPGTHQPLAAGSRHVLLGAGSRLSHNPSLALALALHQQEQQQLNNQQQPGSPAKTDNVLPASASPISHTSAYNHSRLEQSDYSAASGSSPPATPLMLGASSSCLIPNNQFGEPAAQQQLELRVELPGPPPLNLSGSHTEPLDGAEGVPAAPAIGIPTTHGGDILQLVEEVAGVLGGVGPAVEFLKAMHSTQAAAAAAAVAAVQLWQ